MTWFSRPAAGELYAHDWEFEQPVPMTFDLYRVFAGVLVLGAELVIDCENVRLTYRVQHINHKYEWVLLEPRVAEPKLEVG